MNKPSFYISCPFDTYSGYGARSRDIVKAIIDLDKYDVKLLSQRWGDTTWGFCKDHEEWTFLYDHSVPNTGDKQPDIWMQITIPNEFQPVGKFNIGCTAGIESTGCQGEWVIGLNRMNMNFVSSKHSRNVFQSLEFEEYDNNTKKPNGKKIKSEKPIHVIFEGADLDIYKYLPSNEVKLDLSDIKESFCFLFVGMWMEGDLGHDRKNVSLMIKTFFETFKGQKVKPALILKTSTGVENYMSRNECLNRIKNIREQIGGDLPNVYLLQGDFTNSDMNELYNHPKVKAMVSFTKGEGFGRPLMEFCLSKKPIIASGWSGQMDFLNPQFCQLVPGKLENIHKSAANKWLLEEYQWFGIETRHAKRILKDVYRKYKKYVVPAKKQGHYIRTNFSRQAMGELVGKILDANLPKFAQQVELSLPTLNKDVELPKLS
tara:strand:- start:11114 stop:12403 length:1290 start_codon:yes stop_codon:yes gene_type:complete